MQRLAVKLTAPFLLLPMQLHSGQQKGGPSSSKPLQTSLAQMKAIAAVIKSQDWHRVTVVYEDIPSSATGAVLQVSEALKNVGIEIGHLLPLPPLSSSSSLVEELQSLKEGQCRVFVVHTSLQLGVHLFETAKKMEMMKEVYVWIITDTISSLVHSVKASTISSSMDGIVGVKSYFNETTPQFKIFRGRFRRKFISEHPDEEKNEPGIYAAKAYDATWAAALAMKEGVPVLANNCYKIFQTANLMA